MTTDQLPARMGALATDQASADLGHISDSLVNLGPLVDEPPDMDWSLEDWPLESA